MIVELFIPCHMDEFRPETARNTLKILQRLGYGVNYNVDQTCCGQPAYEDGYRDYCKEVGEKLIREFQEERYVVCPGPGCVNTVRNHYPALFHNSSLHNAYKSVQKYFYELSDFLCNVMSVTELGARYEANAVLVCSCEGCSRDQSGVAQQVLLSKVKDLQLKSLPPGLTCCGMGGGLERKNEGLAVRMAEEVLDAVEGSGADTIISADPLVLMHLQGVIRKQARTLKTAHISDVLASGWD
ncbi:MAG: (Fe-S)-binding protein [Sphingobacteriales bacterium]|nr:(Fe-S)-binding protein [Sphingobacteriales bacterium]